MTIDPNTNSKVKFCIGDIGGATWEEISVGGIDYAQRRTTGGLRWRVLAGGNAVGFVPVASFVVSNTTVPVGQLLLLDASGSCDPDGDDLTFEWDFGDIITTGISAMSKAEHV
jgi:hypothetical protein